MHHARVLILCWLAASCEDAQDAATDQLVLRVSTHFGVSSIEPGPGGASAAAALAFLVYRPLSDQFTDLRVEANKVSLTPKADASLSAIRHPKLKGARMEGARAVIELATPEEANDVTIESTMLDVGPYVQESFAGDTLRLRRRSGDGPEVIEVKSVPTEEEEWRRFLAREVDVLPYVSPRHLAQLEDVPSVRLSETLRPTTAALHFRMSAGSPLADVRLRRAISLAVRRAPLAQVITGRRELGEQLDEDLDEARRLAGQLGVSPANSVRLRTILHDAASEFARATLILEQQLALIGVQLEIETLPIEDLVTRIRTPDWEALLFFGAYDSRYYYWVMGGGLGNVGGYANPELDAAIAAGDHAKATALLARDVPFVPLYDIQDGVAMDRSLCSDPPESAGNLFWLASIHRCAPGEGE